MQIHNLLKIEETNILGHNLYTCSFSTNSALSFYLKSPLKGFKSHISLTCKAQKMLKVLQFVPCDLRKVPVTLDHHLSSLCGDRNSKSNGVTLQAQRQLRVKFYLGDKLAEGIVH